MMRVRSKKSSRRRALPRIRTSRNCCGLRFRFWETPRCRRTRERAKGTESCEGEAAMVRFVWEFVARADKVQAFEETYANSGPWVELFRRNGGYEGAVLLHDTENARRYLTIDRWHSAASQRE